MYFQLIGTTLTIRGGRYVGITKVGCSIACLPGSSLFLIVDGVSGCFVEVSDINEAVPRCMYDFLLNDIGSCIFFRFSHDLAFS